MSAAAFNHSAGYIENVSGVLSATPEIILDVRWVHLTSSDRFKEVLGSFDSLKA